MTTDVKWTLSGFGDEIDADPNVQLTVLAALGASHLELRSAWDINIVDLNDTQLADLKKVLDRHGFGVSAIASPIGKVPAANSVESEVERLRICIRAARYFDSKYIRIFSFYPDDGQPIEEIREPVMDHLKALAAEAEKEGVILLHENEKDIYGDIPSRVLDIFQTVDSPALRMAWDAANYVQCGVRPFSEGWSELQPYFEYFQVKDAMLDDGQVVPAGEGDGELAPFIAAIVAEGYRGFVSLEPHLVVAGHSKGYSGPREFGRAGRALTKLTSAEGVDLI